MKPTFKLRAFLVGGASLLAASSLHAATNVTWDTTPGTVGTGDSTITGGVGTWNTSTAVTPNGNWTVDAGDNNIAWEDANNDTAIFGDTSGAVTIDAGGVTVGGLTFNTAGYTIGGDVLTFGLAGSITANADAAISSGIGGAVAISKEGTAALTLSGTNTFSSGITLNNGTLNFAKILSMPASGAVAVQTGTTLGIKVGGAGYRHLRRDAGQRGVSAARGRARRGRVRACRCRCCCGCSPAATARSPRGATRALRRRRGRGPHEHRPLPRCLALEPTSSTSSACMRAPPPS